MKKVVFLLAILFYTNCSSQESSTHKEMKADKSMSEFFTDKELEDLSMIVNFFESEICLDKSRPKVDCYYEYNKNTITSAVYGNKELELPIDYKLQQKLYSKIDSLFFKEIWIHKTYFDGFDLDTEVTEKSYDLNLFGKYILFLKSLKKEDVLFRDFYDLFYMSNEISFGVQSTVFYQFEKKEFKGIKRRLFFAIYYLTVNDKKHNYKSRKP